MRHRGCPNTIVLFLLIVSSGGCTHLLQAGPRGLTTKDARGGEITISYELGAANQRQLYDRNYNGRSDFISLGAEASAGALHDSETDDSTFSGSAMLFMGINSFGAKQPIPEILGLKLNVGIGTRAFQGHARFAYQGDLQVIYARHGSLGFGLSVTAGYMPGVDVGFMGIGITLNYLDRSREPKIGF